MKRYLIVDDEVMSRFMLRDFLSEFAPCDVAEDGVEGLKLFEKALADGNPYSLLCIDLIMPGMNGIALIRKVREMEKTHQIFTDFRTRIFVISASDSPWDKADLLLDNLVDDYIVKPFDRSSLMANLYKNELVSHYAPSEA